MSNFEKLGASIESLNKEWEPIFHKLANAVLIAQQIQLPKISILPQDIQVPKISIESLVFPPVKYTKTCSRCDWIFSEYRPGNYA